MGAPLYTREGQVAGSSYTASDQADSELAWGWARVGVCAGVRRRQDCTSPPPQEWWGCECALVALAACRKRVQRGVRCVALGVGGGRCE